MGLWRGDDMTMSRLHKKRRS